MTADELPEGWESTPLGDIVADMQTGFACGAHSREEGVPHLRPMNVSEDGLIALGDLKLVPKSEVDKEERWLQKGDVLFNNTNSPALVGKTAHYEFDEQRAYSNHMTRLRVRECITPQYLARFLHQLWRESYFEINCNNHVSQASISRAVLGEVPIVLPPLAEQRRIVAAVERILGKVTAARARLDRVPTTLKRFRQAVLAAACSGRLTADWRPNADELVILDITFSPDDAPDVPVSWKWVKLSDISNVKGGVTKGRKLPVEGRIELPYLRVANVQDGFLNLLEVKTIPATDEDRPKYGLRVGDVLFIEGGNREHLGRGAVWQGEIADCIHQNHIFRARINADAALPEFITLVTKSGFAREYFFANASQTVNLASINLKSLSALPLPLPPLAEQHEIVRRVAALFARADAIEAAVSAARKRVDALTQAVLAKAFRGELVPTEAALARRDNRPYEPAADLLARLRSTATAIAKPTRTRKTKPPPTS